MTAPRGQVMRAGDTRSGHNPAKKRRFTRVKFKLICYGCGQATSEGYHVLIDGTILHYCPECVVDEEAVREHEEVQGVEKF